MKKIIIIVSIILIYVLAAIGMEYYVGNDIYIFMGKNVRFHYSKGEWTNDTGKQTYNKFQIYNIGNNKKVGTYDIKYSNGWYARIKNKYTALDGVIMFKGKGSLDMLSYNENGKLDDNEVKKALKKRNLPTTDYRGYYIDIDIDNDGTNEKIYCLRNYVNGMYLKKDVYYSYIYIVNDGNIEDIILDKANEQLQYTNEVTYIMDVNNDNIYEILVSRSDIDLISTDVNMKMYGLEDGKYVKLVSTE